MKSVRIFLLIFLKIVLKMVFDNKFLKNNIFKNINLKLNCSWERDRKAVDYPTWR